ncbi:MAG: hypothetical protein HY516_04685 [Candidatus Aenigmarchaeota archaeon]|nr:hypothetical protein [Candidatus Aenigmarchaeota archaeon]
MTEKPAFLYLGKVEPPTVMTGETNFLDLNEVELYGWETFKNAMLIDSMVRGIEAGDDFPPVHVNRFSDTEYRLTVSRDGGHKRAVAHYITGRPLKVKIEETPPGLGIGHPYPIKDILLVDDQGEYEATKMIDPNYR